MSVSLAELKDKNITDLAKIAKELNIPDPPACASRS